jgi:N-formylglutamate amidohydrolase
MVEPPPPFRRLGPDSPSLPVVLSVPHAGRAYSEALLASSRLSRRNLEALEDRLVDRLVWRAVDSGACAIVASAPRAEIDLNRDERELDREMVRPRPDAAATIDTARTRGGLGLVPSRIAGIGPIWRQRIPADEIRRRVQSIHRPYHCAIEAEMRAARARFGVAILLDCHSMPPRGDGGSIVLGDRHGSSIAPELADAAERAVCDSGFAVSRNAPYAGGHITERHGRPDERMHALQIEIDRSLYLEPGLKAPGAGFDRVAALLASLVETLAAAALDPPQAIAAE